MLSQPPLLLYLFYIHISPIPSHPSYLHTPHYVSHHIPFIPSPPPIHFFPRDIFIAFGLKFSIWCTLPPTLVLPSSHCPIITMQSLVARVESTPNWTVVLVTMGIAYQLPCGPTCEANWLRMWSLLLHDVSRWCKWIGQGTRNRRAS